MLILKAIIVQGILTTGVLLFLGRWGRAQPTRRTLALAFAPVLLLLPAFRIPWLAGGIHFYWPLLLLALLTDCFLLSAPPDRIRLTRTVKPKQAIGERNSVSLTVFNDHSASLRAWVQDGIISGPPFDNPPAGFLEPIAINIPAFGQESVAYTLRPLQRKPIRFGRIRLRYASRLGLLWLTTEGGEPETVCVLPDWRRAHRLRLLASRAGQASEIRRWGLHSESGYFSGLRHYVSGDELRKMAWQATARLDSPVVRVFEPTVEQPVLVLLDAGRRMGAVVERLQKYDWALNTALAFIGVALDHHNDVGVGVFGSHILTETLISAGHSQRRHILELLAKTEVQALEADYEGVFPQFARSLKRPTFIVVLTDLADPAAAAALIRGLNTFPACHSLLVVTVSDSTLTKKANQWPTTPQDAYRRGVAQDLCDLRRLTLKTLAHGAHGRRLAIVDAPPKRLDETLLRHYFRLRLRSSFSSPALDNGR